MQPRKAAALSAQVESVLGTTKVREKRAFDTRPQTVLLMHGSLLLERLCRRRAIESYYVFI